MTQGKNLTNVVTGVGTFTGTKPVGPMPTKATEEDELRRKEVELKRLKEREEEASRKREELMRAKAEEQKRCEILPPPSFFSSCNLCFCSSFDFSF